MCWAPTAATLSDSSCSSWHRAATAATEEEQALLATLWTKNPKQFWRQFSYYIHMHPNGAIPRYYQEAAYLYAKLEKRPNVEEMPFNQPVKDSFHRFMSDAIHFDNQDVEIVRQGLYPAYGQTYYFEYYTMSNLPEY